VCPQLPLNITTSKADSDRLGLLAPGSRIETIPNGVDTRYFVPQPEPRRSGELVFLGPTYMYPNRDAVDWFVESMWRTVRAQVPAAVLHLVGKNPPRDRVKYESLDGVCCNGYVPDVRPYLARASCSIVPIRVGGGTRLKILDSWAMGTAVVSTSIGCEGLVAVDGRNILIRDDPASFAAAVVQVLQDRSLRDQLGQEGRSTVEREYDWQIIGNRLIATYERISAQTT
jgi:glycosyltransferase involved in cell wall biosynthesis